MNVFDEKKSTFLRNSLSISIVADNSGDGVDNGDDGINAAAARNTVNDDDDNDMAKHMNVLKSFSKTLKPYEQKLEQHIKNRVWTTM